MADARVPPETPADMLREIQQEIQLIVTRAQRTQRYAQVFVPRAVLLLWDEKLQQALRLLEP